MLMTFLIGLVVGAIAKMLMPGNDPGGWIITGLLGIAGSWVGDYAGRAMGLAGGGGWIGSILGAMLLLFVYRLVSRRV
jgi:uncharacterized membrane protein YeaQ/YmgE (transglycosylase-associated protein family)